MTAIGTEGRSQQQTHAHGARIFFGGAALWIASIAVTVITRNLNLIPTLVMLGSFLVPVSFVAIAFERWRDEHVTTELIVFAFFYGGILGVLGASVLEAYLLHPSPLLFFGVGLIEEGVKAAALIVVTRRMDHRHMRDGIVLGAAVGFGFAAFESAGYAFTSMLTVKGLSLPNLIETEFVRGILAPVGHGLWTAIIGGVLFHQSRDNVIRYTKTVLGTYLWVSVLHGLWDSMRDLAVALTFVFTGRPWQYKLLAKGYIPKPTPDQVHLFTVISVGGLAVVSLLGIVTLLNRWREASSEHSAAPLASRPRARRAN